MKEYILPKNSIYYRTNDFQPNRETLVFVHGLSGCSSAWKEYEKKFEVAYNILSFDLRGHGKSAKPKKYEDYEIPRFAADIDDLVNHLQIEKFTLISHSFGTAIALEFLREDKRRITRAIFLSPVFDVKKTAQARITRPFVTLFTSIFRLLPFSPKTGIEIDYSKLGYTADFDSRRIYGDIRNTSLRVYMYCLKQIYTFDNNGSVSDIQMPTLIIHGKKDAIMPVKNSIADSKIIKDCKLVLIEKGNHIIPLNNFAEASEAIEDFLNQKS